MESVSLSILAALLIACIVYIIQTQRTDFTQRQKEMRDDFERRQKETREDFERRQKSTHDKMGELNTLLTNLISEIAVLKDRSERGEKHD